jgi:hypothetical protein
MQETVVRRNRPHLPATSFTQRTLSAIGSSTNSTVRRRAVPVGYSENGGGDDAPSLRVGSADLEPDEVVGDGWDDIWTRTPEPEVLLSDRNLATDGLRDISDDVLTTRQQLTLRRATAAEGPVLDELADSTGTEAEREDSLSGLRGLEVIDRLRRRRLLSEASARRLPPPVNLPVRDRATSRASDPPSPSMGEFADTLRAIRRAYAVPTAPLPSLPPNPSPHGRRTVPAPGAAGSARSHAFAVFARERRETSRSTEVYRPGRVIRGESWRRAPAFADDRVDYEELLGSSSSVAALASSASSPSNQVRTGEEVRTIHPLRRPRSHNADPSAMEDERPEPRHGTNEEEASSETSRAARRDGEPRLMTAAEFLRGEA